MAMFHDDNVKIHQAQIVKEWWIGTSECAWVDFMDCLTCIFNTRSFLTKDLCNSYWKYHNIYFHQKKERIGLYTTWP